VEDKIMDYKQLKPIVEAATFEEDEKRKLSCPQAFELAAKHKVELLDISRVCNREGIKLCKCQLGCFK